MCKFIKTTVIGGRGLLAQMQPWGAESLITAR